MDATLVQLLDHIYDLEQEKAVFVKFLLQNEAVLRAANAVVPGLPDQPTTQAPEEPAL